MVALASACVVLRLAFLSAPEGADEGGYLAVARQWHGAGPSLYGRYWVDRPPLLIGLFQVSSFLGGLSALRVLGALAAGVAVLGVADACWHLAGGRAAIWGTALAAALFVSPQLGTVQVNGELLAAPLVAWSIALWLHALRPSARTRPDLAAFAAGALAVGALLVKQNMAEPLVFGAASTLVGWRSEPMSRPELRRLAAAAAGGMAAGVVLVGSWTTIRGASVVGVFDAMYPFRIKAVAMMTTLQDRGEAERLTAFLHAWVMSGVLLVVAAFVWAVVRHEVDRPVVWGMSATLLWATVSMLFGGGFWDHYLVELIVPIAVIGGLAAGSWATGHPRWTTHLLPSLVAGLVVTVALIHWTLAWGAKESDRGVAVGTAIRTVAAPGDTLVSAIGDAETVDASGLGSPYPYLWTLPAQVDDPRLNRLTGLLTGPDAPTWLVPWDRPSFPSPVRLRLAEVLAGHYRRVGEVCGHPVLLRDGVIRPIPPPEPCGGPLAAMPRW